MSDESRILRERQLAAYRYVDLLGGSHPFDGVAAELGVTAVVETYPTSAEAFYAVNPATINGEEEEGVEAVYVVDTETVFFALNIGSAIPPPGTMIVWHGVGGRYVFRWDG